MRRRARKALHRARERLGSGEELWAGGAENARFHLEQRIEQEHLRAGSSPGEYAQYIAAVISAPTSEVFHHTADRRGGVGVVGVGLDGNTWYVKLNLDGQVVTAFRPVEDYTRAGHRKVGTVESLGV